MRAELVGRAPSDNPFDREGSRTCRDVLLPMPGARSSRSCAGHVMPSDGGIAVEAGCRVRSQRPCVPLLD